LKRYFFSEFYRGGQLEENRIGQGHASRSCTETAGRDEKRCDPVMAGYLTAYSPLKKIGII
jgi:hypothetical protein